jgi:hypothetical protein
MSRLAKLKEVLVKASGEWPEVCSAVESMVLRLVVSVLFFVGVGYVIWQFVGRHVM